MAARTAILSDIHGNLEALEAVLADAADHGADRFVCLGDNIGFGADIVACVDRVREVCAWSLMGDHEYNLREYLAGRLKPDRAAEDRLKWEADLLVPGRTPELADKRRWDWVRRLETQVWEGKLTYIHARPTDPVLGWIGAEEARSRQAMSADFEIIHSFAFHGHSHVPGIVLEGGDCKAVVAPDVRFELSPTKKALIDVGSVGQPRDGHPEACYVLHEGMEVRFRRVSYDVEAAARKIEALPVGGREMLGMRLRRGR